MFLKLILSQQYYASQLARLGQCSLNQLYQQYYVSQLDH